MQAPQSLRMATSVAFSPKAQKYRLRIAFIHTLRPRACTAATKGVQKRRSCGSIGIILAGVGLGSYHHMKALGLHRDRFALDAGKKVRGNKCVSSKTPRRRSGCRTQRRIPVSDAYLGGTMSAKAVVPSWLRTPADWLPPCCVCSILFSCARISGVN